jgi:cytochrome c-type biogenesis protein CcmE
MGDLDKELRDALNDSEAQSNETSRDAQETPAVSLSAGDARIQSSSEGNPKRNIGLLVGLLVVAAGILTLVFTSVDDAAIYSVTTDQLVTKKSEFLGRNVRVEGDLVSGSLRHRKEPCEYRFSVEKNGQTLPVRYPACIVPDTFKDVPGIEVQVTAEGKLNEEGYFEATHIMAKCPSKYEMQQRAAKGEEAPHDMMGGPPEIAEDEE